MHDHKALLAITLGDINGIGPEIVIKALAQASPRRASRLIVFGDADLLESLRPKDSSFPPFRALENLSAYRPDTDYIPVLNCGASIPPHRPGTLDPAASAAAVQWISEATRFALEGSIDGLVTCPVNKEGMLKSGSSYGGHTPLIAALCKTDHYRMCLFSERMRIVHITAHCSLRQAVEAVKKNRIVRSVEIGYDALLRLGLSDPHIAVSGLNPHSGEAGAFGQEEILEIAPAVAACQKAGIRCSGPYPPDTVFKRMQEGEFDMVISMYHDQGHIPLKLVAMDEGVNVTLGLPIVRTSVDHGTAYDIAGKDIAREDSLCAAISLAAKLAAPQARSAV